MLANSNGRPPQIIVIPQSMLSQQTRQLLQYRIAGTNTMQPILIQQQQQQQLVASINSNKRAVLPQPPGTRPVAAVVGSKRPAPSPSPTSLKDEQEEEEEEEYGLEPARKRANLDHLTPEERLMRRKMKNRVAAQTARDKKKAYMDEMEQLVAGLRAVQARLEEDCATLASTNQRLEEKQAALAAANQQLREENLHLRQQNNHLLARLTGQPEQQEEEEVVVEYTEDLNVEAASFVIADTADILSESNSSLSSAAEAAAAAIAVIAQPPEPAVLTDSPLQQERVVATAAVAATAASTAVTAAPFPPLPSSEHVLSSKDLTTEPATVGPWVAALLQSVVCSYIVALWTTFLTSAVSAAAAANTMTVSSVSASSVMPTVETARPLSSPSLPLKKRRPNPPQADPPPD